MRGMVLAGGIGSRMWPMTYTISKQLLPIYDKPMIYYPLTTLMLADIREILVITTPNDAENFKSLLSDGSRWGLNIQYAVQPEPKGIAHAFLIGEKFINHERSVLILGDNIFYGAGLSNLLKKTVNSKSDASIFAYWVNNPNQYGIVEFSSDHRVKNIIEKPTVSASNYAVTGLYFYDEYATDMVKELKPSIRGELEITDLNNLYFKQGRLSVEILSRGFAWLDTGTPENMLNAAELIATVEARQGLKIGCPEEIAWRKKWISDKQLLSLAAIYKKNSYGSYLESLLIRK